MLEKDPRSRFTMAQVADHEWFSSGSNMQIPPEVLAGIQEMDAKNEAKLKISELLLDKMNVGNLHQLNQAFLAMDRDQSGSITQEEARDGADMMAQQTGLDPDEVAMMLAAI